jgi:hypothetical protein
VRSPSWWTEPKGPPRAGPLVAVVYVDQREQTCTTLFRVLGAAQRFADRVEDRGGIAHIYSCRLDRPWTRVGR